MKKTRVRFAPSPTGPLHMGGVRTALYNYLYAKQKGGDFLLRIEDTDSNRFVPGAEEYIIEALNWCGIIPDEGVGVGGPHAPYRQSERREIYKRYADELVEKGYAYYAFDSSEELTQARTEAENASETFIYGPSTRASLKNSLTIPADEVKKLLLERQDWTVRFKMPENELVEMDDLIRGHISVNTATLDDKVLWKKADELPTYHLANIVDDHLMEITEVIRGEEWLPSLPLHYLLYKAFGWERPQFAHLPLLLKPIGNGKLSKRDGDKMGFPVFPLQWTNSEGETSHGYREDGYFPDAFVNLLAMLGWNPGTEQEIFSMEQLIEAFSLEKVGKAGAKFNPEKAKWFNKEYLRMKSNGELAELFIPILKKHGINKDFNYIAEVVEIIKERATFVEDFWKIAPYLFIAPSQFAEYGVKAGAFTTKPTDSRPVDPRAKVYDESLTEPFLAKDSEKYYSEDNISMAREAVLSGIDVEEFIRSKEWPLGKVMNCMRLALTGSASGLGIGEIIKLIGVDEAVERIDYCNKRLSNK